MKNFLFPHIFQPIGWMMFILSLMTGVFCNYGPYGFGAGIVETVLIDAVVIGIAVGALFIVCSKECVEDEMTKSIRLASLLNSLYVYVALLIACTLLLNGIYFLEFCIYNLILFPIIFVCFFRMEKHKYNKMCEDEE